MRESGWFIGAGEYEQRTAEDGQELQRELAALRAPRAADPDGTAEDDAHAD